MLLHLTCREGRETVRYEPERAADPLVPTARLRGARRWAARYRGLSAGQLSGGQAQRPPAPYPLRVPE